MPISENNTRIIVTISKELKQALEQQAKKDNRSVNNLIATVLLNYIQELK